jgi:hypothetical protein
MRLDQFSDNGPGVIGLLGHERDSSKGKVAIETGRGHWSTIPDQSSGCALVAKLGQVGDQKAVIERLPQGESSKPTQQGIIRREQFYRACQESVA